jgi:GDP-L-fucose synthase
MNDQPKIFIAGHNGMVGSAIERALVARGRTNIVKRSRRDLDLTNQSEVERFFATERPDQVYLAAAKVGGIHANNTYPAEFIYLNLMIEANVIHSAFSNGVKRLLFLGSSCIYPKLADQPMSEEALLSGKLESTNEPYAVAKIAGIKLCESYNRQYGDACGIDYRSVMPTNLYGPGDNYHAQNSHVIPGLIRRFHEAKIDQLQSVSVWGTGAPRREFLHVDDMASACIHVMTIDKATFSSVTTPMCSHINVGYGEDVTIAELAETIADVVGFTGQIVFDTDKPDGTPRKLMAVGKLQGLGWTPRIPLRQGLEDAYAWYIEHAAEQCN